MQRLTRCMCAIWEQDITPVGDNSRLKPHALQEVVINDTMLSILLRIEAMGRRGKKRKRLFSKNEASEITTWFIDNAIAQGLIQKLPDGKYCLTTEGRKILQQERGKGNSP